MSVDIKEMVVGDKKVKFLYYKDNELWYVTETNFEFPVPISDTAGATFKAEDKAIFFMRWLRSHVKNIEKSKEEQSADINKDAE
jgi:hypothetical protein